MQIFGESHGASVGLVIDGCPAGLALSPEDFIIDIERRKGGVQKGTTPRKEDDLPIFKSGIFNGKTTGAPIAVFLKTIIPKARIMKSIVPFQGPVMQILRLIINMGGMKISEVAGISVVA